MRLLAFSDLHVDTRQAARLADASGDADVVVGVGAFASVHSGLEETLAALRPIAKPVVLVPGNNETEDELRAACEGWDGAIVLHGEGTEIGGVPFFGLGGGDSIIADQGDDVVYGDGSCPAGAKTVEYCSTEERASDGGDSIRGGDGNDTIYGQGGADAITGDNQDDTIDGGSGADNLDGGDGNDKLTGGAGSDAINAANGNDTIDAGAGDDAVSAGDGNDTVDGGAGNDAITTANGRSTYALKMVKRVAFSPSPSASVTTAVATNVGLFRRTRVA